MDALRQPTVAPTHLAECFFIVWELLSLTNPSLIISLLTASRSHIPLPRPLPLNSSHRITRCRIERVVSPFALHDCCLAQEKKQSGLTIRARWLESIQQSGPLLLPPPIRRHSALK